MPSRWTNAAYTCLMVALYVAEPSHIQLSVQDRVRMDRVTATGVEQQGELIQPGTTSVFLAAGTYYFRTTRDAQVHLGDGAAVRVTNALVDTKDPWPGPKLADSLPVDKGDSGPDRVPTLTVR